MASWKLLRRVLWTVRRKFYSRPKPSAVFVAEATLPELEGYLGSNYFEPNWELSYDMGEALNLRRVVYEVVDGQPEHIRWWQLHIRAWEHDDGVEIHAHFEPEPTEYPREHLGGAHVLVKRGMSDAQALLELGGIPVVTPYER